MHVNSDAASRLKGHMQRLGLSAENADRQAGLPSGSVSAILRQAYAFPRSNALRRLAADSIEETKIIRSRRSSAVVYSRRGLTAKPEGSSGSSGP